MILISVLAAGGKAHIEKSWDTFLEFWNHSVRAYLDRRQRTGSPRWDRWHLSKRAP